METGGEIRLPDVLLPIRDARYDAKTGINIGIELSTILQEADKNTA